MRRIIRLLSIMASSFQSTHPVWDATHAASGEKHGVQISIHASRMGCDTISPCAPSRRRRISIHASRMGCDSNQQTMQFADIFQSTHPVWDATRHTGYIVGGYEISIHASRMGCDALAQVLLPAGVSFQSTHPVWDATARMDIAFHNMEIFARSSS